ncbi:MAG: hypothetical protein KF754_00025 [Planctomycetes bacterium]|nr:hypothetical protein [Planctomycetota bacterium]
MVRKLSGSKRGGDYCWSAFTCEQPSPPWYLRGSQPAEAEPPPEDSREVPVLPQKPETRP